MPQNGCSLAGWGVDLGAWLRVVGAGGWGAALAQPRAVLLGQNQLVLCRQAQAVKLSGVFDQQLARASAQLRKGQAAHGCRLGAQRRRVCRRRAGSRVHGLIISTNTNDSQVRLTQIKHKEALWFQAGTPPALGGPRWVLGQPLAGPCHGARCAGPRWPRSSPLRPLARAGRSAGTWRPRCRR